MEEERHRDCTLSIDKPRKKILFFNDTLFFNGKTKEDECLSSAE